MRPGKKDVGGIWGGGGCPTQLLHLLPHSCPSGPSQSTNRLASHTLTFPFPLLRIQCTASAPHRSHPWLKPATPPGVVKGRAVLVWEGCQLSRFSAEWPRLGLLTHSRGASQQPGSRKEMSQPDRPTYRTEQGRAEYWVWRRVHGK